MVQNGRPLGNMVIKLGLDSSAFSDSLTGATRATKTAVKEMQAGFKVADAGGNKLTTLAAKQEGLTKVIQAQKNELKYLGEAYKKTHDEQGNATSKTAKAAQKYNEAQAKLASYEAQLKTTTAQMARMRVETEGLTGWLNQKGDQWITSGKKITKFGDDVQKVGSTMTKALTVPLAAGFTLATNKAADFQTQIGEIGPLLTNGGAITKEYREQLDQMSDSSKKWAKQYGVSTTEINNGLAEIVRKGYDANQTMGVMPSILDATKASGEKFNDVMNVTTEVISQFGLKGKTYNETLQNTARVTDSLTYVANATSAGFSDLGLAMGYVGPVANSLGMEVEETAAAVGLLSDAGLGGEKAGTALRGALTRLLKPSEQNIAGFEKLGISVDEFKNGTLSLPEILDKIKTNTVGWTDAQRTAAIALAFGTESQSAMNVLVGQGGDALRNLTKETKGASGATRDIAKSMNDLPANKVARFKESVNVLAITVGEKLLPVVTPWIEKATDMVNKFSELDDVTQNNIVKWGALAMAAGPALKIVGSGISIFGQAKTGVGLLSKSLVELTAKAAEKSALAGLATTVTSVGTAASSAAGGTGIGAMTTALVGAGGLASVLPIIVGAGGLLAVGYGAWKLFGEEAWNSSQRVARWGSDVGAETDAVLGKIQSNTQAANGEFTLMEQGFSGNTEKMIKNFEQIGVTIENELTGQINAFRESMKLLPEEIQGEAGKIIDEAAKKREHASETVKANNERILAIKREYTNKEGEVTAQGAKMIQDLMKQSTQEYLKITVKDADDRKQVMDALTGNVETASAKQAEAWVKNLGKQRQQTKESYSDQLADYKAFLDKQGILHTEEGEKLVKLFEQSRDQSTEAIDAQIALIAKKYPELAEKISFSNGQMINSMDEGNQAFIAANQKIIDKANTLSNRLAENAKKNATQLAWTADEATKAGQIWNGLKLVDKEGNVKTNSAEIVTNATKDVNTWNNMRMVIHDANLDSNAKSVIGEAAIANNWWDGMAWDDKKAILHDEFSAQVVKALEDSGRWAEMSFEEKKAIIYSNTPEVMAETMLNLGLWEQYQPQVKALGADNYQLLNALSFSETALAQYNGLDPDFKELIAADPASLTFDQAKKLLDLYNTVSPEMKTLLGDNTNVNAVVAAADKKLRDYDLIRPGPKQLHATADTSAVDTMEREIARIPSYQEKKIAVVYEGRQTGQHAIAAKTGLNYHLGGPMIVNDQKGPLYRELVVRPNGESFIPFGRDVLLPNEPKGTKVYTASQTKRLVPRYAKGTEIPENSKLVKNLRSIESQSKISVNVTSDNSLVESKLDQLIRIMADFGRDLRGMQIIADNKVMANVVTNEQNARNNMIGKLKG